MSATKTQQSPSANMSAKSISTNTNSYIHFSTGHEDLVHDVAYGSHPGRRHQLQS